ncbi:MAG TPA: helix-turn-helix transcriptional regulator [Anaerolineaceae bacterium]|jgi:DNA-binding PadR family transcriptional regulator|nr:helix-turn-helix transcriptional regulator [Anaerolineaceae bacterium]
MTRAKEIENILPLTETSFYILLSLIQPLHGYGIIKKIEEMTAGRILMGAGTLYGALKNLLENGLIVEVESSSDRRRDYQITLKGKDLVLQELIRYEELIKNARSVVAG